jgi:hypothetical protein
MTTVTPQAIDAYVFIESIRIVDRHRKELGDLQGLMKSIEDVGLLHPPTITEANRLVAGQRRLEACRRLGWDNVPVRIAKNLDEAARLLRAERDENVERKEMLPSEKVSLGLALEAIQVEDARLRAEAGRETGRETSLAVRRGLVSPLEGGDQSQRHHVGEVGAIVGEALGMSRTTYGELRYAYRLAHGLHRDDEPAPPEEIRSFAESCLAEIDRTGVIQPNVNKIRARLRARKHADEAKSAALSAPISPDRADGFIDPPRTPSVQQEGADWVPSSQDSSARAVARRREIIRACAARGMSSSQIGEHLSILPATIRRLAREEHIAIPADQAMGPKARKRIDSNRIVRETVQTLEGLEMGLKLVDFNELDLAEIGDWTVSLSESIRRLNRLNKRLKEKAQ